MPSHLIRIPVKRALVDLLRSNADLSAAQVVGAWPGDSIRPISIWVGSMEGKTTYPTMTGPGQLWVDDDFTIPLNHRVVGQPTVEQAEDVLEAMVAATVYTVANNRFLSVAGVKWALVDEVNQLAVSDATLGPVGAGLVTVKVSTRITGV